MIDIKQFRENATKENLCSEYVQKWDACGSRKQYIDLALSTKGVDYLCDSIAKGWGISPQYICDNFNVFINGNYISLQNGYDSEMYCRYKGEVLARTTVISVLESEIEIKIPKSYLCHIYVAGKSKVNVKCEGECILICYGDNIETKHEGNVRFRQINKKERDRYD